MSSLIQIMKQASLDASAASMPCMVAFGTVMSTEPLRIQVDQKLILGPQHLILTGAVENRTVRLQLDHQTEAAGGHSHSHQVTTSRDSGSTDTYTAANHVHRYAGEKTVQVLNGLATGDNVVMLRVQGGQKYIVMDKVVSA